MKSSARPPANELEWRISQANERAADALAKAAEALRDTAALKLQLAERLTKLETEQIAQRRVDEAHEKRFEKLENRLIATATTLVLAFLKIGYDLLK